VEGQSAPWRLFRPPQLQVFCSRLQRKIKTETNGLIDRYYSSHNYDDRHRASHAFRDGLSDSHPPDNYRRRRWPPQPSVEDEKDALRKEYRPQKLEDNDVKCRGVIDQEPMLIQLISPDTRFVLVSDPAATSPVKNDSIKSRRTRGNTVNQRDTPELKIQTQDSVPTLERISTPYSFSRTPAGRMTSNDYFLSPESTKAAHPGMPRSMPAENGFNHMKGDSRKPSSKPSKGKPDTSYSSDETRNEKREELKRRSKGGSKSARNSATDLPGLHEAHLRRGPEQKATSAEAGASRTPTDPPSGSRREAPNYYRDVERPSGNSTREPSITIQQNINKQSGADNYNETHYWDSRHTSLPPFPSTVGGGIKSPRIGGSPRPDSRPDSPHSPWEPFPFEAPHGPYDRLPEYQLPLHQKPKPPSRLSSMNQAYIDDLKVSRTDSNSSSEPLAARQLPYPGDERIRGSTVLPYPEENHPVVMPGEFRFLSPVIPTASVRPSTSSSSHSNDNNEGLSQQNLRTSSSENNTTRPTLERMTSKSKAQPAQQSKPTPTPVIPELPTCPRHRFSSDNHNWYGLVNCDSFDICTSCYNNIIRPTRFQPYFRPGRPHPPNIAVRCDFANVWVRLAWLVTIKEQRDDLDLLYALAKAINSEEPCPENDQKTGTWYALLDKNGNIVNNFFICPRDKESIVTLFPSLKFAFVRLPSRIHALCALRSTSRRFHTYIDVFDAIHDSAISSYYQMPASSSSRLYEHANLGALVSLATHFAQQPECPRDRATPALVWHFLPDVPDLTVCPECYDSVIAPDAAQGHPLALSFTPSPRTVPMAAVSAGLAPGAVHGIPDAWTCCLYSDRMRDLWDAAVSEKSPEVGTELWVREAKERKRKECELGVRKAELMRRAGSVRTEIFGGVGEPARVKRELERLEDEWSKWE
jgi:hypothetical protein